jgi:preprotein translocase subunit SecA
MEEPNEKTRTITVVGDSREPYVQSVAQALAGIAAMGPLTVPDIKPKHGPHPKKIRGYRVPEDPNKGTGRNDPCPCGSGKKYKKCCIKRWNL